MGIEAKAKWMRIARAGFWAALAVLLVSCSYPQCQTSTIRMIRKELRIHPHQRQ